MTRMDSASSDESSIWTYECDLPVAGALFCADDTRVLTLSDRDTVRLWLVPAVDRRLADLQLALSVSWRQEMPSKPTKKAPQPVGLEGFKGSCLVKIIGLGFYHLRLVYS